MNFALTFDHRKTYTEALKQGLQKLEHRVDITLDADDTLMDADIVVFNGMRKEQQPLRDLLTRKRKPFLVIDLGYMNRGNGAEDERSDRYYQLGWNRIGYVPPPYLAEERTRFNSFGLNVVDDRDNPDGDVLIIGQVQNDTQHHMAHAELNQHYIDAAFRAAKMFPESKIIMRRHPRAPQRFEMPHFVEDQSGTETRLIDALLDARCIITINSTTFYEATCAGVPVISGDESICHYHTETTKLFEKELKLRTREQKLPFLRRMAHAQFTLDELADGLAIIRRLGDYHEALQEI